MGRKNLSTNSFEMLGRMAVLLDSAPYYREHPIKNLGYRFMPAIASGKVRYYMQGNSLIGFCTWCFKTDEEARTGEYDGTVAFSRDSGDQLWVVDMVALDSVLYIGRDMRRYLGEVTDHDTAYWKRPNQKIGRAWRLRHG